MIHPANIDIQRSHVSSPVQTASAPQSPIPTPTIETILDDTSLAATILANGDRHVYFQDSAGLVRWATRSSSGQWHVSPKSNISSDPQDRTPLAATAVERDDGTVDVGLHRFSSSHVLTCEQSSRCFMSVKISG